MIRFFYYAEYVYSKQLRALEELSSERPSLLPQEACIIQTPLKLEAWQELLGEHPDKWFADYILQGIEQGFRIGFHGSQDNLRSKNMVSAREHPVVVAKYLGDEVCQKRVALMGPLEKAGELGIHCSPFGVIPKKIKINKWRLILDLSSPEGHSVNDGVQRDLASLSYMSMDDVVAEG